MAPLDPKQMDFVQGFKGRVETIKIIHDKGRTVIMAFDGEFQGRELFNIREMYEQYGKWNPGKGISVPIEKKAELLKGLVEYAATVGVIKGFDSVAA